MKKPHVPDHVSEVLGDPLGQVLRRHDIVDPHDVLETNYLQWRKEFDEKLRRRSEHLRYL